jgi:hypothetical protein
MKPQHASTDRNGGTRFTFRPPSLSTYVHMNGLPDVERGGAADGGGGGVLEDHLARQLLHLDPRRPRPFEGRPLHVLGDGTVGRRHFRESRKESVPAMHGMSVLDKEEPECVRLCGHRYTKR